MPILSSVQLSAVGFTTLEPSGTNQGNTCVQPTPVRDSVSGRKALPLPFALTTAGLLGNYFKFELLNLHVFFGSVFAMPAVQWLGAGRGTLAAAIIAGYTYFVWNHSSQDNAHIIP